MTVPVARVGDIAEQVRGVTYQKEEVRQAPSRSHVALLTAGNITESGIDYDDVVYVPDTRVNSKQALRKGDVLIAASSGSLKVVGKAGRIKSEVNATFGAFCKVLRPTDAVDPVYFSHFFRTPEYRSRISHLAAGANINNLRNDDLNDLELPLPRLPEQRRIAAILDQADELRTKGRRTLTLLDELADSNFARLFTGRNDVPTRSVHELLASTSGAMRTGPFGSQLLSSELVASGIPVLGIDNVVSNEFLPGKPRFIDSAKYQQLKKYTVRPGDVLITIMGTVGRCAVVPPNVGVAINTKHLCCITLDQEKCLPEYLRYYFLKHPDARNYLKSVSKGAIMDGLNMGLIRALPVRLPSISEQQAFVDFLGRCNDIRSDIREESVQLDELFASLQHRAFRGEL